jgi:hypothetical protein|tara:strand:- start:1360 stop:1572 length:213 start_codon:yes stop_codon:yes gene_type:complete
MTTKKITASDVAADLAVSKKENGERWKTAFNEFADIKQEIAAINNTIKMATFGVFGFIGALSIAVITVIL